MLRVVFAGGGGSSFSDTEARSDRRWLIKRNDRFAGDFAIFHGCEGLGYLVETVATTDDWLEASRSDPGKELLEIGGAGLCCQGANGTPGPDREKLFEEEDLKKPKVASSHQNIAPTFSRSLGSFGEGSISGVIYDEVEWLGRLVAI